MRMRSRTLYARSPHWADLLGRAEELIGSREFVEVKNIGRNRAGFLAVHGGSVFVKRFAAQSWAAGLVERLRGSRAARSLTAAAILDGAGFRCPLPLAASEQISAGAIRTSWIIGEALTKARVFSAFIERGQAGVGDERGRRRRVLAAVASCIRHLHNAGLFTSDLQETNLMLEQPDGELKIYFVDLDQFRRLRRVSWKLRRRNLVQLDRSVGRFLSRTERLHFLRAYLGEGWDRTAVRKLIRRLASEREGKDREYERRRRSVRAENQAREPDPTVAEFL